MVYNFPKPNDSEVIKVKITRGSESFVLEIAAGLSTTCMQTSGNMMVGPISHRGVIKMTEAQYKKTDFINDQLKLQMAPLKSLYSNEYKFDIECGNVKLIGCFIKECTYTDTYPISVVIDLFVDHIENVP